MGCTNSVTYKNESIKKLNLFVSSAKFRAYVHLATSGQTKFSIEEANIIKKTWPHLMNQLQVNGLQLFLRIFEICPDVKTLFHLENVRLSQLARDATLKAHGGRFMSAIGDAVSALDEDGIETLEDMFLSLGKKHQDYQGFQAEYFEVFYEAIMCQLERSIGTEFKPEVSNAWSRLIVFIIQKLKEGYMSKNTSIEK